MKIILCLLAFAAVSLSGNAHADETADIDRLLDAWHRAAATADEDTFFGSMAAGAIYLGTDATERWEKEEFMDWSMKYFERDKAWDFTPYDRHIYFSDDGTTAWFEEYLDTWMGVCGGSGVLAKTGTGWKIKHYHLAVTVPNDLIQDFKTLVAQRADKEGEAEYEVMAVVRRLFDGMRAGDRKLAASAFGENVFMGTVDSREGAPALKPGSLEQFLDSIGRPHEAVWDERLFDYSVHIDGDLALVWTKYSFYLGDTFSHCGADAIQLLRGPEGWEIVGIVDTRRKEGCEESTQG